MAGKVEICGVNTAKLGVLKGAETDALLLRVKDGDAAAREELIQGNLRLVLSVIQKFSNRGENADDLFQVGCIGLMKAIDNFDTTLGVRFSTYGVPMNVCCRKHEQTALPISCSPAAQSIPRASSPQALREAKPCQLAFCVSMPECCQCYLRSACSGVDSRTQLIMFLTPFHYRAPD